MECRQLFRPVILALLMMGPRSLSPQTAPIKVDPVSLGWLLVPVGSVGEERDVAFQNATNATVTFKSITVSGGDFAISSNTSNKCGASVPAKSWCLVGVTFSPTAQGNRSGTLTIAYDGANSPQTVQLSGTGSGPLTIFPVSLPFGDLRVGVTSPRALTVTNRQNTAVPIAATSATGDFAVGRSTCGTSIGPSQKCVIEVTFTPVAAGPRTGQLSVAYGTPNTPLVANLSGSGTTTGMTIARQNHAATALNNGMVLVAGGSVCTPFCTPQRSAELYNPTTATFSAIGNLSASRSSYTATPLKDGTVLLAGGEVSGISLATAELYDPATGTFTPTGSLNVARHNHTATLLNDGTVLLVGGSSKIGRNPPTKVPCAELYNPATKVFKQTGCLGVARNEHSATLLNSGKVLIAGGNAPASGDFLASAELYDPATGAFTPTGAMAKPHDLHTATLLKNGTVLIAGGADPSTDARAIADAELYNPEAGTFSPVGGLHAARYGAAALLLNNGVILISGGADEKGYLSSAELYDPSTKAFAVTGSLQVARIGHKAALLKDGLVLIVGGQGDGGSLGSAELFDPAKRSFASTR